MSAHTYILGISAFYHDSAACLLRDGEIIAAAQEERFSRKRHDHRFPQNAIDYCLAVAAISAADLNYVAFYDKPWIKFERILETYLSFAPRGLFSFLKACPLWIKEKLWMGDYVKNVLGYEGELIFPEHHQSHAASAFFPSPYERAALLTLDGVGEWATTSWGRGENNKITILNELHFPHSLGLLYSAFTYYTGFKVNSGEYKVMGLAPYGEPKYVQQILEHLIDIKEDGSFRLNMDYFNYCQGLTMTNLRFDKLFGGAPRWQESQVTQKEMDLARSVQEITEMVVLKMARHIKKETGEKNLCLAGGVALNCVANGKILKENIFDNLWIQPAAGDAGGALGAALFAWHQVLEKERKLPAGGRDLQKGSYLGPQFSEQEIESWLTEHSLPHKKYPKDTASQVVAQYLAEGKVIGWFSGRMEFGPRALGARSIIGDPRNTEMQKTMNLKIKYRESFRPFAPSVLAEDVGDYFELDRESPYMLFVAPVKSSRCKAMTAEQERLFGIDKLNIQRSDMPAITHVDYSARVQTVHKDDQPEYHRLLEEFKKLTGYSVVVNTSFNVRGEPIVCTPEHAYRCFMRTEMDVLVLENCILLKSEQPQLAEMQDWRKEFELD
ncbi:MAG: carbamoyltransferase [Deltaproteobacteria bacterium]|nr:carbamoyltransferase [Deltaproteobacteria bacterium]